MLDLPHPLGDDGRDTVPVELEFGAVAKRLEAKNLKLFQFEQLLLLESRCGCASISQLPRRLCDSRHTC